MRDQLDIKQNDHTLNRNHDEDYPYLMGVLTIKLERTTLHKLFFSYFLFFLLTILKV